MNIEQVSKSYYARRLSLTDINDILNICENNIMYYEFFPPQASAESIKRDMEALPPNKTCDDKYYLGFYNNDKLIAIIDLILNYPEDKIAFIGFFMVDENQQGNGVGSIIIDELLQYLKSIAFVKVKLGYIKGNQQSEKFWLKNQFSIVGKESEIDEHIVVIMEKIL